MLSQTPPLITLTTDFGYKDPFVAMMKGVMLRINPLVKIVDITHDISSHNIREAALAIGMSHTYFPSKTIHVVVVDPGVGSGRRPILAVTDHHYFIGPDNGVFSLIYTSRTETLGVIHLTAEHYFMSQKGPTFHGRDIFAPAAAWLTRGVEITKFGDYITDHVTLPFPAVSASKTMLEGEIMYIDRFGNAITNITTTDMNTLYSQNPEAKLKIVTKGKQTELKNYYSEVTDKNLYSIINSTGFLELFVYRSSAAQAFDIKIGDIVGVILTQ